MQDENNIATAVLAVERSQTEQVVLYLVIICLKKHHQAGM